MAVAGMREDEVINRGIRQNESCEKPCPRPLLANCPNQSPDRQYGRSQEQRTAKIPRCLAVGGSRHAIPIIEKSLHADHRESPRMLADPLERQPSAIGFVPQFAHAL